MSRRRAANLNSDLTGQGNNQLPLRLSRLHRHAGVDRKLFSWHLIKQTIDLSALEVIRAISLSIFIGFLLTLVKNLVARSVYIGRITMKKWIWLNYIKLNVLFDILNKVLQKNGGVKITFSPSLKICRPDCSDSSGCSCCLHWSTNPLTLGWGHPTSGRSKSASFRQAFCLIQTLSIFSWFFS